MSWSYRKRIKIAPGVHINLGKNGISTSVGVRGASMTFGKNGTYVNTGIPGTGLYSRKKISGTTNSTNSLYSSDSSNPGLPPSNSDSYNNGCRISLGLFGFIAEIVAIFILLRNYTLSHGSSDYNNFIILVILWGGIDLFLLMPILFPGKQYLHKYGYNYLIKKYNDAEARVLAKSNEDINRAKLAIDETTDSRKLIFLQSFVDSHQNNTLSNLFSNALTFIDAENQDLSPAFTKIANLVVQKQSVKYLDFYSEVPDFKEYFKLCGQMFECGIIDTDFETGDTSVLVSGQPDLDYLLNKAKGKSLISKEEKERYIAYVKSREDALCPNGSTTKNTTCDDDVKLMSYKKLLYKYQTLIGSKAIWEVISSAAETEKKSASNTLIDRKRIYSMSGKIFDYVKPLGEDNAPYFEFGKDKKIRLYIYPDFVVQEQEGGSFDIISFADFDIEFSRSKFLEQSSSYVPTDAKFIGYTYKYVNKNGERDARYSNNPQYGIYEYGYLTFKPFGITLQISNADAAEGFYQQYKALTKGQYEFVDDYFGATEDYFNDSLAVATALNEFYLTLLNDRKIVRYASQMNVSQHSDNKEKLRNLYLADVVRCFDSLGHDCTNLQCQEGLPMAILEGFTVGDTVISYSLIQTIQYQNVADSVAEVNTNLKPQIQNLADDFFFIQEILHSCRKEDLIIRYFTLLYRFFSVVAKSDGTITEKESKWLERLMSYSRQECSVEDNPSTKEGRKDDLQPDEILQDDEHNPLGELKSLIGLSEVKKEVETLANFVKIQKEREKKGLKSVGLSYHCVFTGNPGTGKTTVARIVASIYKNLGLLKKGHLVETDRSGLVAEYVGQTAVKTNKIIDSALDGVLFIDEAYSLVQGGASDYGMEAISTLLKRMEDDRDRLIVILAGYSDEMKQFIDSNPGLQSRFNRYIHFEDYTADELKEIFLLQAKNNDYELDDEAKDVLGKMLSNAVEHKDKNFGNGRFVRNLFETSLQKQAGRLARLSKTTTQDLCLLTADDITNV